VSPRTVITLVVTTTLSHHSTHHSTLLTFITPKFLLTTDLTQILGHAESEIPNVALQTHNVASVIG
jgi:hypothetical protein